MASAARAQRPAQAEPSFGNKLTMLYCVIAVDAVASSYADPLASAKGSMVAFYVCMQVALVFGTGLAYFLVVSRVVVDDRGRPLAVPVTAPSLVPPSLGLSWIQTGLLASAVHTTMLLIQRGHRLALRGEGVPYAAIWNLTGGATSSGFATTAVALLWTQRIVALVYYATLIRGAHAVAGGEVMRRAKLGKF